MRYNLYVKEIKGYELYKEFRNNIPDIADENKLKYKENEFKKEVNSLMKEKSQLDKHTLSYLLIRKSLKNGDFPIDCQTIIYKEEKERS